MVMVADNCLVTAQVKKWTSPFCILRHQQDIRSIPQLSISVVWWYNALVDAKALSRALSKAKTLLNTLSFQVQKKSIVPDRHSRFSLLGLLLDFGLSWTFRNFVLGWAFIEEMTSFLLLLYEKLIVVGGETCQNPGHYNDVVLGRVTLG